MANSLGVQSKGQTIEGYLAIPKSGQGPGLIVLHAWWGLNDFFKRFCDHLAGEGFVVIAPDLYNGQTASIIAEAEKLRDSLNNEEVSAKITAALDYLRQHPAVSGPGIGVIGFSLGAAYALWLSTVRPAEVKAVVVFYGTYIPDFASAQAAYLGHYAEVDEWEPLEGVHALESALRAAGRQVTFHTYSGVGHWFFESTRPDNYNPAAARLAWDRTLVFLKRWLE